MQARSDGTPSTPWSGGERAGLLLLTLLALLLRLALGARIPVIEPDGAFYGRLAQDRIRGEGTRGLHPAWPPGYPALVATAARVRALVLDAPGDPADPDAVETAARAVSAFAGALLVPLVVILARRTLGARTAWVAGLLAAAHPNLLEPSAQAMTESTFALALVLTLTLLGPGARLPRCALAGVAAGAALLVRPEGVVLVAIAGVALLAGMAAPSIPGRRAIAAGLAFLIGAAGLALPHVSRIRQLTGHPGLGMKSDYNLALAYAGHPGVPEIVRSRSTYNNLTGAAPAADFPEPIPRVSLGSVAFAAPGSVLAHLLRELPSAAGALPSLATWPVALLALVGAWWRRRAVGREERLWLILWLAYVGLYALVFVYRRFFTGLLPLLLIPAALPLTPAPGGTPRWNYVRRVLLLVLLVSGVVYAFHRAGRPTPAVAQRRLGTELRVSAPPAIEPGGVAARKPIVAWYADRPILAVPEGDSAAILTGCVARGARYLVVDAFELARERPGLSAWVEAKGGAPPGWTVVTQFGTGVGRVRLLERTESPTGADRGAGHK